MKYSWSVCQRKLIAASKSQENNHYLNTGPRHIQTWTATIASVGVIERATEYDSLSFLPTYMKSSCFDNFNWWLVRNYEADEKAQLPVHPFYLRAVYT